jgi:hypothetical protein
MLIPWARCVLWCKDHQAEIIAPQWSWIHPKRLLREGRDERCYWGYFNNFGYVKGFRKAYALTIMPRIQEADVVSRGHPGMSGVVVFYGLGGFALPACRSGEIASELLRISNVKYVPALYPPGKGFLALHVRLGDFGPAMEEQLIMGRPNIRQPIRWYLEALRAIKSAIRVPLNTKLYSDGTDEELAVILKEPGVERSRNRIALTDLWEMSTASVIIGSRSSFTYWASYLGQVPTLYFQNARPCTENAVVSETPFDLEPEWIEGNPLPARFIEVVRNRIRA